MDLLFPYAHLNLSGEAISEYPLEEDLLGGCVLFRNDVNVELVFHIGRDDRTDLFVLNNQIPLGHRRLICI